VGHQRTATAELGAQPLLIGGRWLDVAQSERALLMGARAIARAK
jgi:hypothetical protein